MRGEGSGAWEDLQPHSPVCKSVEPSPVRPGMSFQFSNNLNSSAMWVFGVQRINSPENLFPWPQGSSGSIVRLLGRSLKPRPCS